MSQNVSRCLKCLETSQNRYKYLEMSLIVLKSFQMPRNVYKCVKMSQNILKSSKFLDQGGL